MFRGDMDASFLVVVNRRKGRAQVVHKVPDERVNGCRGAGTGGTSEAVQRGAVSGGCIQTYIRACTVQQIEDCS